MSQRRNIDAASFYGWYRKVVGTFNQEGNEEKDGKHEH